MGRARLAELHGVATSYEPAPGRTVQVPEDTVVAVLAALGVGGSTPLPVKDALDRHARRERDPRPPPPPRGKAGGGGPAGGGRARRARPPGGGPAGGGRPAPGPARRPGRGPAR